MVTDLRLKVLKYCSVLYKESLVSVNTGRLWESLKKNQKTTLEFIVRLIEANKDFNKKDELKNCSNVQLLLKIIYC